MSERSGLEPLACRICRAAWFRRATFRSADLEFSSGPEWAVCVCGSIAPSAAMPIPRAAQQITDVTRVAADQRKLHRQIADGDVFAVDPTFANQLANVERVIQSLNRRMNPAPIATRSSLPRRAPATRGLDTIVLDLQRTGMNF